MCDCTCSNVTCMLNILANQTQKYFWVFYMFLKVILYFHVSSFCSTCILVFFIKNWFRGCFARSSRLRASRKMCLREIKSHTETLATASRVFRDWPLLAKWFLGKKTGFFTKSHRNFRDCLVTNSFSQKHLCFSGSFRDCFMTYLLLPSPRKTRVFFFM